MEVPPSEQKADPLAVHAHFQPSKEQKTDHLAIHALFQPSEAQKGLSLILVIDGSGSIAPRDFATMKISLIRLCTKAFEYAGIGRVQVSAIQFSTDVTIHFEDITDLRELDQKIQEIEQKMGRTDTSAGLALAFNLLGKQPLEHKKLVFLFTDGEANTSPNFAAFSVRSRAKLISFGVGKAVDKEELETISDKLFLLENGFVELDDFIKSLSELPHSKWEKDHFKITLSAHPTTQIQQLSSKTDLHLRLKIENLGPTGEDIKTPFSLNFLGNSYFFPKNFVCQPLKAGEEAEISVVLVNRNPPSHFPFPHEFVFQIYQDGQPQGAVIAQLGTHLLRGDFVSDRDFNILVFGPMGAGKSSLVDCFYTMNLPEHSAKPGKTAGVVQSGGHVTTKYDLFSFSQDPSLKIERSEFPFNLFDIWGVTTSVEINQKSPYEVLPIGEFLAGRVPLGTEIGDLEEKPLDQILLKQPEEKLVINAVIVVIPQSSTAEDPDSEEWRHFRNCIHEMISKHNHNPIVVVTKMDELRDISGVDKQLEVQKFLGLSGTSDIYLHQNYSGKIEQRSQAIDFSARSILLAARDRALSWRDPTKETALIFRQPLQTVSYYVHTPKKENFSVLKLQHMKDKTLLQCLNIILGPIQSMWEDNYFCLWFWASDAKEKGPRVVPQDKSQIKYVSQDQFHLPASQLSEKTIDLCFHIKPRNKVETGKQIWGNDYPGLDYFLEYDQEWSCKPELPGVFENIDDLF